MNDIQLEFMAGNNEEYEFDDIWDSMVYIMESATKQLLRLYYIIL